jgi:hypothetical protein
MQKYLWQFLESGGILCWENNKWVHVLKASNNIQVHGLVFLNAIPIFTNPKSHNIQAIVQDHVEDWAGSGNEGSPDGPASHCQFGQFWQVLLLRRIQVFMWLTHKWAQ